MSEKPQWETVIRTEHQDTAILRLPGIGGYLLRERTIGAFGIPSAVSVTHVPPEFIDHA